MAIEALSDGAVKMGIPRPLATQFAAQMVYGSAKMVLDTKRHPGSLRDDGTYIRDI
jgi:pyrroline-5-carboxylate reductase